MFRLSSMVWALTAFAASFASAGDVRKRLCSKNMLELVLCIKRDKRAVWGGGVASSCSLWLVRGGAGSRRITEETE